VASEEDSVPDHDRQDDARRRQIDLLRELAARLEHGDPPLPTDVFAVVLRELELYRDDDAIEEAYREQGERKAEPWVFCRGRVQG
jgi:hypothetical protein